MRRTSLVLFAILTATTALGSTPRAAAQPVLKTESFPNSNQGFVACEDQIRAKHAWNLLAGGGVRLVMEKTLDPLESAFLTDGQGGERAGMGRVPISGAPTVLTWYLGEPKTLKEVGLYTFNGDSRANQDYEVRFFNNAAHPGVRPTFRDAPDLTTGATVLGRDAGGFHSCFVDSAGGRLVAEKADWIEIRIWGCYGIRAGEPAKQSVMGGWSAYIEVEVLGEAHEVTPPSPAEIAYQEAVRRAPPPPGLIKQSDWRASLIATREAIVQWEAEQDRLAIYTAPVTLGPWHVLGPLPPNSPTVQQLDREKQVDLAARLAGRDGQPVGWQRRDDLQDGQLIDLTGDADAAPADVVYLCREVSFKQDLQGELLPVRLSASDGRVRLLPEDVRVDDRGPLAPNARRWRFEGPAGSHQLLVRLTAGRNGKREFWFAAQPRQFRPGAGDDNGRAGRRNRALEQVEREFASPLDVAQMRVERAAGLWTSDARQLNDWLPGRAEETLASSLAAAVRQRLAKLRETLSGDAHEADEAAGRLRKWTEQADGVLKTERSVEPLRGWLYRAAALDESAALAARVPAIRRAVEDQRETWGEAYPQAAQQLAKADAVARQSAALCERIFTTTGDPLQELLASQAEIEQAAADILLANPILRFGKLLVVKGNPGFNTNWGSANRLGQEICVLSPVRPDGQLTTVYRGSVSDMDLHWDARRLLFCDGRNIWEMQIDGSGLRQVSATEPPVSHYDACYLPDGRIACVSNACEQAVPCTGGADVGNLHVLDADGKNERRVTFDQDHDWNPTVMHDGRVLYTRWEYTDTPHYFSRLLFRMNPDGSGQMEYYGSNSYWPNAMYWPRPIPGHPTMVCCVVSGHHGVSRAGELLLLDPAQGRHEAAGAVQRIPGWGKPVQAITMDQLVLDSWPKFAAPWPLAEPDTHRGAGKYFLVGVQKDPFSKWDVCLVDVFDNVTPILRGGYITPIPVQPRPQPPVLASHVDLNRTEATVYMADVYQGPGLQGFPRGSIKQLRVGSHHYRYAGNGDTAASSLEGGWDVKKILGTVPVLEDGSALFRVPANTPIFVQPLDAEGKSQQVMRSWFTAMPGEVLSCVGCHEQQNSGPPAKYSAAAVGRRPAEIEPWFGPPRGFSFDREVQPVLDRRCVGCHNGQPSRVGDETQTTIDLRAKRLHADFDGPYSPAYVALQRYVRRPGYESDYHMPKPAEYEADTSVLVQMLKKGHYGVQLTGDEWSRLYAWIDFNVPYPANWRESHRPPQDSQVERRVVYKKQFAKIDDRDEEPLPLPPLAPFEPPAAVPPRPQQPLALAGWPFAADEAQQRQRATGPVQRELDLGDGVTMRFQLVPAGEFVMGDVRGFDDECAQAVVRIERPFYLGQFEVTNAQYARFDPRHDNGVINERWKDRSRRGTPINAPDQPVVRISWHQALAFCEWLSARSGARCTLPTEAQWEWACRAGTATPFAAGDDAKPRTPFANVADGTIQRWNHGRAEPDYQDGVAFSGPGGRFPANAWGLHDLHGNVAEWCLTTYQPYPYRADDGRDDAHRPGKKVVRGGSWNDSLRYATSASRWRYEPYKPVHNVGFRVLLETAGAPAVASAAPTPRP